MAIWFQKVCIAQTPEAAHHLYIKLYYIKGNSFHLKNSSLMMSNTPTVQKPRIRIQQQSEHIMLEIKIVPSWKKSRHL